MSEQTGQFRSAAFGGFHRQDVLDYVEKLTKEKQEVASRLEEEETSRLQAETRLAEAEEKLDSAMTAQNTLNEELDYLRGELESRSASLSQAETEIKSLRAQVERLRPAAESWERIKEQAGTIELSAHERAQITIQDAHTQAEEIQAESVRWLQDVQALCDRLREDLAGSIHAAEERLDDARESFRSAEGSMDGYHNTLSRLLEMSQKREEDTPEQ